MQQFNTYRDCIYDQKALLTKLEVKMALYSTNTEDLNSIWSNNLSVVQQFIYSVRILDFTGIFTWSTK